MNRSIKLSRRAQDDIRRIFNWLKQRSPRGAENWLRAVYSAINRMETDSLLFAVDPRSKRLGTDFRTCPFSTPQGRTYQLFYVIEDEDSAVRILRIRGPGQRPLRRRDLN